MKNAKAYVALAGSIATALLGTFTADSQVGKVLTVVSVVATAVSTWAIPNTKPADERGIVTGASGLIAFLLAIFLILAILWLVGVRIHVG
jgi:hypothetical protein